METLLRLEPDPNNPSRERLVGLEQGTTALNDQVVACVQGCRRLFPHIVGAIAENRLHAAEAPSIHASQPPSPALLEEMGRVRDELLLQLGPTMEARTKQAH